MTNKLNKIFHLSQMGFAFHCDYFICHRTDGNFPYDAHVNSEILSNLPNGSKIFMNLLSPNHQYIIDHFINTIKHITINIIFILCMNLNHLYII